MIIHYSSPACGLKNKSNYHFMRLKITPLIFLASLVLHLGNAQAQCNATFQETNGYASIEAEDLPNIPSGWQKRSFSDAQEVRRLSGLVRIILDRPDPPVLRSYSVSELIIPGRMALYGETL